MKITNCRFCDQSLPEALIKLSNTPLANELLRWPEMQETFPLQLTSCRNCHLYQLNYSVEPERLFNENYSFVTGTSESNQLYFRKYAESIISRFQLKPGDFVIELASNDGTLLKVFKEKGMKVLGIDPATAIANQATKDGIETIGEFFTEKLADQINIQYGEAKIIISNNMLAHVDNVNDIIKGIKKLLCKNGIFVFENSYFSSMYENNLFDIIYHEHKSYPLVFSMQFLFKQNEMCLFDVLATDVHGGSIRGFVSNDDRTSETVDVFINTEKNFGLIVNGDKNIKMNDWKKRIASSGIQLWQKLDECKKNNKSVAIFGAPAKATTLLSVFNIKDNDICFAIDDNLLKQNKFLPGRNIKIHPFSYLAGHATDYLLILSWNFSDSIMKKCRENGYKGKFIVPLPEVVVYE